MTTTWHVSAALAARYAAGSATETDAWSLEKHVEVCGSCAARVSAAVRSGGAGPRLDDVRAAVLSAVAPAASLVPSLPERTPPVPLPGRLRPGRLLWAAGPALRGAWLVAVVLVAAGAVGLAYGAGFAGARPLLLAVAPVLPLAGVALSYGRHTDPMYEISAATPSGGLRLLLTRAAAVLAVSVPLLTAAGAVVPAAAGVPGAAAWLLPGLALTLAALALGSFVGCRTAAAAVGSGWTLAVVMPAAATPSPGLVADLAPYLSGAAAQGAWAAAAVVCAGLLAVRRHSFDFLTFDPLERV
ncbi:zf-HC2 domain-containing protein [Streptomyces sp. SYSU K21746]